MTVTRRLLPVVSVADVLDDDDGLVAGARVGRYTLIAPLGVGGTATVWLAEHTGELGFRRLVALKVVDLENGTDAGRRAFLDEARIGAAIRHTNVVQVHDVGQEDDRVYLALDYVEGATLIRLLHRGGAMRPAVALRIALDVLLGLQAAHALRDESGVKLGLVHRDVSPQNVLVGIDGVTKLSDFGIAKALGRRSDATRGGHWKGKIRYAAPEQLEGRATNATFDIYAAGVVMWEMLTGQPLYTHERLTEDPPAIRSPRELSAAVPATVADAVMVALAHHADGRYRTALAMIEAIERAAGATGSCGIASHREVAELVERCVSEELSALRALVRERGRGRGGTSPAPRVDDRTTDETVASPGGTPIHGARATTDPTHAPSATQPPAPRLGAIAGGLTMLAVVAAGWLASATKAPPPDTVVPAQASAAVSTAAAPAPMGEEATLPLPSLSPLPSLIVTTPPAQTTWRPAARAAVPPSPPSPPPPLKAPTRIETLLNNHQ